MFILKLLVYWIAFSRWTSPAAGTLRVQAYKKALISLNSNAKPFVDEATVSARSVAQRLPQALLIGVRKSGTRALLEYINLHPLVAAASDEVHFFDNDTLFEDGGLEAYRLEMPFTLENQITIEKTPAYFSRAKVPRRIKDLGLNPKFIVVFRNPVDRTISDYTQVMSNRRLRNVTFPPFEHMAFRKIRSGSREKVRHKYPEVNRRYKAVNISTYVYHMQNWLKYFPLEQFHFVDGDRLVVDPLSELLQMERFLDLPHAIGSDMLYYNKTRGFYCMKMPQLLSSDDGHNDHNLTSQIHYKNKCLRPDKGRKHPTIAEPFLRELKLYFRPLNEELFRLIHRRFDWD